MTRQWRVENGPCEVEVVAEGWLDALATALPQLGLELTPNRLSVELLDGGTVMAVDPITGIEIVLTPTGESPAAEVPSAHDEEARLADEEPSVSPEARIPPVSSPPVAPPPPPSDALEDLFLRLGEISDATGVSDASGRALRILLDLVPAAASAVLIRTTAGDGLRFRAVSGPASGRLVDTVIPLDRGIAGFVCQLGLGIRVSDVQKDRRHDRRVDRSTGFVTEAMIAVPVRSDSGAVYGVVELLNPPTSFTDADLDVASRVAASLGAFLESLYR